MSAERVSASPQIREKIVTIDEKTIEERFANIRKFRLAHNLPDCPLPTGQMSMMLLDNKFYNDLFVASMKDAKVEKTSEHESTHELAAFAFGWSVRSVEASQDWGLTICVPPPNLSFKDWLIQSGAISVSSTVGAQMLSDRPRGTGSDNAYVRALAALAVESGHFSRSEEYISIIKSSSHRALSAMGGPAAIIKRGKLHAKQNLSSF